MFAVKYRQRNEVPGGGWTPLPASNQGRLIPVARSPLYPTDPKPCVVCGTVFSRRQGERRRDYLQRRTCGRACAVELVARANTKTFPPRPCATCGKRLERHAGEIASNFRRRKTCGTACGNALRAEGVRRRNRRELCARYCVACGALLERRAGEAPKTFIRRTTCDAACGAIRARATRRHRYRRVSPYPAEWQAEIRPRILERDGHCCRLCHASPGKRSHHVHHIDGVKSHVADQNLVTLCHACHARVTNGDGAHWRAILAALIEESDA